jgi:hypothetical protein
MRDPWTVLEAIAVRHPHYREWIEWEQIDNPRDVYAFDLGALGNAVGVFRYASIFHPRFIEVEGCIALDGCYEEENWKHWRERRSPAEAAAMINHTHLDDLFGRRPDSDIDDYVDDIGELLAFFWKLAVDHQFPDADVQVEYKDRIVRVWQEPNRQ